MKQPKIIFFDFDGVIADSFSIAFEVAKMSKPTLTQERYRSYFSGNINEAKHTDKIIRVVDFFKEFGERFKTLKIADEKKNVIKKLAQKFQLFIISSTPSDIIRIYLQKHDILPCFTEILGNEIHESKIKKFQMLYQKYSINPKDVIFITDSAGDIGEAKEAGIQTIVGILGGYQERKDLEKEKITAIIDNFSQFYDFVQKQS